MDAKQLMKKAVKFHGHACPGLALGVMVAKYILEHGNDFSIDEELVAVVENNNCSVDAIQALIGTTFGKGNLIFLDFGKNNYTIYNRTQKKGIRISLKSSGLRSRDMSREERIEQLLNSAPEDVFEIKPVEFNPPKEAEIHESIRCDKCGEPTMSTRIKIHENKKLCIPCYNQMVNRLNE
ncbi:MAG: FmdE family protein [Promethearchaeota archaeon]